MRAALNGARSPRISPPPLLLLFVYMGCVEGAHSLRARHAVKAISDSVDHPVDFAMVAFLSPQNPTRGLRCQGYLVAVLSIRESYYSGV